MPRKAPYRLKHYHELKFRGRFSPDAVTQLILTATAVTLGSIPDLTGQMVSVDEVDLYDINHKDTGTRRFLGKSYGDVRVYKSTMTKINASPLAGRIALTDLSFDHIGRQQPSMSLYGNLQLEDPLAIQKYKFADEVQHALDNQKYGSQILGDVVAGQLFDFGNPVFWSPPNENYDHLVNIQSFKDMRFNE